MAPSFFSKLVKNNPQNNPETVAGQRDSQDSLVASPQLTDDAFAPPSGEVPRLVLTTHEDSDSHSDSFAFAERHPQRAATIATDSPTNDPSRPSRSRPTSILEPSRDLPVESPNRPSTPPNQIDIMSSVVDSPEALPNTGTLPQVTVERDHNDIDDLSLQRSRTTDAGLNPNSAKGKKGWRSNSVSKQAKPQIGSAKRQPTGGIAGALAASSIAMVHPAALPTMQQQMSTASSASSGKRERVASNSSSLHASASLPDLPGTSPNRTRTPSNIGGELPATRQRDVSNASSKDASEMEEDSEADYDSPDLDLNDEDIPVTGFAVASNKRNADFHDLFRSVPEGDYLIEDYGCALQREILIQGRLYISENHICFHANIFGWITDLIIPTYDILSMEKKMTAFVIPNAIQITSRKTKYTFASFLARDTVYDVIHNIWRTARPDVVNSNNASARASVEEFASSRGSLDGLPTARSGFSEQSMEPPTAIAGEAKTATQCACGKKGEHYPEKMLECVLPGTPDKVYTLLFASAFIKDFMRDTQKLIDIQISDWAPSAADPKLLSRNMSYIKPLSGSFGPSKAKCEIRDETVHMDYEDYVCNVTTTRTPEVPSGGVFAVKTRTCIMWAGSNSTRLLVTTAVEWSGRSFIKSVIERSVLDGQRSYHKELEQHLKRYIGSHIKEFVPEGAEAEIEAEEAEQPAEETSGGAPSTDQRGLQWALDTFTGAYKVGKQSATGAIELIKDAWDQSSSTSIIYAVVVVLVLSNIYTFLMVGRREEVGRRKAEDRKSLERQQWIGDTVKVLMHELRQEQHLTAPLPTSAAPPPPTALKGITAESLEAECQSIQQALQDIQARVKRLKQTLGDSDLD